MDSHLTVEAFFWSEFNGKKPKTLLTFDRKKKEAKTHLFRPPPPQMATSSKLSSLVRRRLRPSSAFNFLPALSHARQFHLLTNPNPKSNSSTNLLSPHLPWNAYAFRQTLTSSHSRFFSTGSSDDSDFVRFGDSGADSGTQLEVMDFGATASTGDESLLPVQGLISVLDQFHELTGLPW